ncbi:MAG: hypothetical protein H6739_40685 [Alphaproteobacteria bacterium]|nr:hypothetical protein [Alphaproteobacteria bacterium]
MLLLALLACADDVEDIAWCEGPVAYDYAPDPETSFTTFPDDFWTVEDPSTPTGLRVSMAVDETPVLSEFPENYVEWFDHLSTLDGWGLSAGLYLRFTDALDPAKDWRDDLVVAVLSEDGAARWPVEIQLTDRDETLLARPLVPFPEAAEVVAVLVTDPTAADCISPSPALRARLTGDERLSARARAALDALDLAPEQVGAMTLFTTQSATLGSRLVAEDIHTRDLRFTAPFTCADAGAWRDCTAPLTVGDYRDAEGIFVDGTPQSTYDLPVRVWLPPAELEGPYPALLCGHGLAGSTNDCLAVVGELTRRGVAMVAVDAVEHGDHPARREAELDLLEPLMIFALRINPPGLHGLRLRDNFRQSAWDKLQVVEAIAAGVDVDGDGADDLLADRLGYAGVSLGAIMAPELLALSDRVRGGWTAAGGARVTQIIQDSPTFGVLVDLMAPSGSDQGLVDRAFPILQTLVDPGDPVVYLPHLASDRLLDDGAAISLMAVFALNDEVVPNSTNDLYARALGAPGVGEPVWPVEGVDFEPGPLAGNLPGGATGGALQLAEIHEREGDEPRPAEHGNMHDSWEGFVTQEAFLDPLLFGDGPAVIVDPRAR